MRKINTKSKFLALTFFVVMTVLAGAAVAQSNLRTDDSDAAKNLTGTWNVVVTPPLPDQPFRSIMTFTEDGNLIETAAGPPLPALGNPGMGVWGKTGDSRFAWTFVFYDYDISLQLIDTGKVRAALKLDKSGDRFTGRVEVTIYDLAGNILFSGPGGTVEGKRLKLEPLP